jgi:hypothetical protein
MSFGSTIRRWFGAGEPPLRSAMVAGIEQAAKEHPATPKDPDPDQPTPHPASGHEVENPFDDTHLTAGWLEGTARVVSMTRSGEFVGPAEFVVIALIVTIPGQAPYEQPGHRQLVIPAALPTWQPGSVVPVAVNPADPSKLVVG